MTSLIRFSPVDSLLNSFFHSKPMMAADEGDGLLRIRPRVDIHEENDQFVLIADLPGVKKEDLQVDVEGDQLLLRAKRESTKVEQVGELRSERHSNVEYMRSFSLGEAVETDKINGRLEDGVLHLTLPKREKHLPRRIEVS